MCEDVNRVCPSGGCGADTSSISYVAPAYGTRTYNIDSDGDPTDIHAEEIDGDSESEGHYYCHSCGHTWESAEDFLLQAPEDCECYECEEERDTSSEPAVLPPSILISREPSYDPDDIDEDAPAIVKALFKRRSISRLLITDETYRQVCEDVQPYLDCGVVWNFDPPEHLNTLTYSQETIPA